MLAAVVARSGHDASILLITDWIWLRRSFRYPDRQTTIGAAPGCADVRCDGRAHRARFRGPDGQAATVIVMRKHGKVWTVFNGAVKTTVALSDAEAVS